MKNNLKIPVLVGLISLSLMTAYVFAENDKSNEVKSEDVKQQTEITRENNKQQAEINRETEKNKRETEKEMADKEEMDNEVSLHDHFAQIPDLKTVVTVPQVDVTKVNTYADIVTILNQDRDIINQVKDKGNTTDFASSTLSTQEKNILSKISSKHSFEISRTNVRADELLSQIKDLTDILAPLGTQTIVTDFNLKNLLISQLNDFSSSINSLTDLVDTTSVIFDEETN